MAAIACAVPLNGYIVARQTSEFLGTDTRIEAGDWLRGHAERGPLLIASGFYFRAHPAIAFTAATYERLAAQARAAGEYFDRAAKYAAEDPRPLFDADFLDIQTSYRVRQDGTREFPAQPFPLDLSQYRDRYRIVIVPEKTVNTLHANVPELASLNRFLRSMLSLRKVAEFKPRPWRNAGPDVLCVAF